MLPVSLATTIYPLQTVYKKEKVMLEAYFLPVIPQNPFWISTVTTKDCSGFKFSTISEERDAKGKWVPQSQITVPHTNKIDRNKNCSSPYT